MDKQQRNIEEEEMESECTNNRQTNEMDGQLKNNGQTKDKQQTING
jgi:hypothetical protein